MDAANATALEPLLIQLFVECFGSTTVAQFSTDITYFAMLYFGGFNMMLATVIAILGAAFGMCLNFAIGYLFSNIQKLGVSKLEETLYLKWQGRFNKIMPLLGALSFLPLMGALIAVTGFLRVNTKTAALSIAFGQALYYGYHLAQA